MILEFDDWYSLNEEEINIELAETGADREMDFDSEKEFEKRYIAYLGGTKFSKKIDYGSRLQR